MVILHVLIALLSATLTTVLFFRPWRAGLVWAYVSVALTFASGFYLVATKPAHILESCLMGLVYIGVVAVGIAGAQRKLARH